MTISHFSNSAGILLLKVGISTYSSGGGVGVDEVDGVTLLDAGATELDAGVTEDEAGTFDDGAGPTLLEGTFEDCALVGDGTLETGELVGSLTLIPSDVTSLEVVCSTELLCFLLFFFVEVHEETVINDTIRREKRNREFFM